jgi:hypothetical protein
MARTQQLSVGTLTRASLPSSSWRVRHDIDEPADAT